MKLDLRQLEDAPTDYFIICEGDSNTQVKSISEQYPQASEARVRCLPRTTLKGTGSSTWICLDYFNTVVHVFYRETRSYYELEDLWGDAQFTEYETL